MKAITLYIGLDVHKDSIVIAIAESGRNGELRLFGTTRKGGVDGDCGEKRRETATALSKTPFSAVQKNSTRGNGVSGEAIRLSVAPVSSCSIPGVRRELMKDKAI